MLESFLGITNNVPVKAELLVSMLAEIELTDEEQEIAGIDLQQILTDLVDKAGTELSELGPHGSEITFESRQAEAKTRIYKDHYDRLLALCEKYGLTSDDE